MASGSRYLPRRLIQQPLATSTAVNNCYLMGKGVGTQFNTNLKDQCLGSIFIYLSTCPVLVALPPIKLVDTRTRKPPHHTMVMFPIKVKLIHQAYKWYPWLSENSSCVLTIRRNSNVHDDKTKIEKTLNSDILLVDKYKTVLNLFVSHHHGQSDTKPDFHSE